jgi:exopolysaccharide biosynthesis predicted pyruvyltransferase EpsI
MPSSPDLRTTLRDKVHAALTPLIGERSQRICLVDPPDHPNVGDNAITLGELDYLADAFPGARVFSYDIHSFSEGASRYVDEADVLLIHGGGNFGDIWPHHHRIRLNFLRQFPHKRIIQLPQSVHFSEEAALRETAEAIAGHPDFTLIVRDQRSYDFAQRSFSCRVELVPDMAFAMKPIVRKPPARDFFGLLRTDKEVRANHRAIIQALEDSGRSFVTDDWLEHDPPLLSRATRLSSRVVRRAPDLMAPHASGLLALRRRYAEKRVEYGIGLLSQGKAVVTDRLHAHILSCLLSIPNVAFDSFDRKISAFYETWTHIAPTAGVSSDPAELPKHLEGLVASNG